MLQVLLERLDLGATLPEAIARAARDASGTRPRRTAEPAFINSPEGQALARAAATRYTLDGRDRRGTGIEFLAGGRTLAAAEPVRRGGGSAAVVEPLSRHLAPIRC